LIDIRKGIDSFSPQIREGVELWVKNSSPILEYYPPPFKIGYHSESQNLDNILQKKNSEECNASEEEEIAGIYFK